ncbi:MAG: protein-L-isoaspartate(D-aspartate) O-methyltransferase [Terriglobales bacterium]
MPIHIESEVARNKAQLMVELQLRRRGIIDERVLNAMERVPRHQFAPNADLDVAYADGPIPIAEGQTISQPYIVAVMLEALQLTPVHKVLEVGTGSGYQTALIAELAAQVYSMERHARLAEQARAMLDKLGYTNISVFVGDGSQGLPEYAPFDAIVVSAAAPKIPAPLFDQLREGGRMVLPIGSFAEQDLILIRKRGNQPVRAMLEPCRFVPLIGREAFPSDW